VDSGLSLADMRIEIDKLIESLKSIEGEESGEGPRR
jgi:hypothetical protein